MILIMKEENYFYELGNSIAESEKSQLFGKPCYKIGGKAFICFFENEMVFKLSGEVHSEALSLDDSKLFDPSHKGRPMKEWVQVPIAYKEKWPEFAEAAAEYLKSKL